MLAGALPVLSYPFSEMAIGERGSDRVSDFRVPRSSGGVDDLPSVILRTDNGQRTTGNAETPRLSLLTAYRPGAVSVLQLSGSSLQPLLAALTGVADWPISRSKLADLGGIDRGLVVLLRRDWAQITPHGGVRVVERLIDQLVALGAVYEPQPCAADVFPEAHSSLEADMLFYLATAASPAAIDLLLAQPQLWQRWVEERGLSAPAGREWSEEEAILARSDQFDGLVSPSSVVVVGRPNVGKSTLTNRMLGRSASLVADLPGTTRDWVAGLVQLSDVAVRWVDTPGLRQEVDTLEQHAVELARTVIQQADLLIAVRDVQIDWPDDQALVGRKPDLWAMNKIDQGSDQTWGQGQDANSPLGISARTGTGLNRLQDAILDRLGFAQQSMNELWAFSPTLRQSLTAPRDESLKRYVGLSL